MILVKTPQKLAWLTLVMSFVFFVLIVAASIYSVQWLMFRSVTDLQAEITVARGTIGVRSASGDNTEALRVNALMGRQQTVATDEIAQTTLQFVDTRKNDRVIALVTVLPGSQVRLVGATRPRFSFGDSVYDIRLADFEGRLEIEVPSQLPNDLLITVTAEHGEVLIDDPGLYLLFVRPNVMTVIPRGNNVRFHPFAGQNVVVPDGQTAELNIENQTLIQAKTTYELVNNPLFNQSTNLPVPDSWGCSTSPDNPPRASQNLFTFKGRRALYILREGSNLQNNEAGCTQFFGERQQGLDVSGYDSLRIRATFEVMWHSLGYCGNEGSECPLMLELTYINQQGYEQRWLHGFYSFEHSNPDLPRTCNSCLIPHEQIAPNIWYTYESGNLFDLPEGFRPGRLLRLRFYASGHAYEVAVGEISILGERR